MVKIDWDKVVTQAVTTLVVGVFIGAFVIVWNGATTVTQKVKNSEDKVLKVVEVTSEEMSKSQSELRKEMAKLRVDISNQINGMVFVGPPSPQQVEAEEEEKRAIEEQFMMEQKVLQVDLLNKFQSVK